MLPDWVTRLSSLIALLGFLPYLTSVVSGQTSPARTTWITWSALMIGTSVSMYAGGERQTLWLPVGYAVGDLIVVLLAIKRGYGGWSLVDRLCLISIGISLIFWLLLKSPEAGLACQIIASTIGFIPTVTKVYADPKSEDWKAWSIWLLADWLCLLTIKDWTFITAAYPITSALKCTLVVGRIVASRSSNAD